MSLNEIQIGFDVDESVDQVVSSLELVLTKAKNNDFEELPMLLAIGQQRYLQLEDVVTSQKKQQKGSEQHQTPIVWDLLKQLPISKMMIQRIDLHFHYRITSDKEERQYTKSKHKLQFMVSKLAQHLQKNMKEEEEKEQRKFSIDGNSNRVEEPMQAIVTGKVSIIIAKEEMDE